MEYTTKAYPTEYRGRMYRSRLEAKWAAFFDGLGFSHEYEPFDLGSWSPDFLVRSTGFRCGGILVEVKPISAIDDDTISKMVSACKKTGILDGEETEIFGALLVGISPRFAEKDSGPAEIGWLITHHEWQAHSAVITWAADYVEPKLNCDVTCIFEDGWFSVLEGDAYPGRPKHAGIRYYPEYVKTSWARACNAVQWRAPR